MRTAAPSPFVDALCSHALGTEEGEDRLTPMHSPYLTELRSASAEAFDSAEMGDITPEDESFLGEETEELWEAVDFEDENSYVSRRASELSANPRMKFEFQTRNVLWRSDGKKPPTKLHRKYGPNGYLIAKDVGVRLESENGGFVEFETEWLRKLDRLQEAIEFAIGMTRDFDNAPPSPHDASRRLFPYPDAMQRLRVGTPKELRQGYWDWREGQETRDKEQTYKILQGDEIIEVEIVNGTWIADIQSSEGFLLHQFESYLRHHEQVNVVQIVVQNAKLALEDARPAGTAATELQNLLGFIQIIMYYIWRGQTTSHPENAKSTFALMCRTSFSSMYQVLLRGEERKLFRKMVAEEMLTKTLGLHLNRNSRFFRYGYGNGGIGPTVFDWLESIIRGQDLLSIRHNRRISAAMGRYQVESAAGKHDRWHVKFETRGTITGRTRELSEWVSYALQMHKLASERRRQPIASITAPLGTDLDGFLNLLSANKIKEAISLAKKRGVASENQLTDLVFHSIHPERAGRAINRMESTLVRAWHRIREEYVRPALGASATPEISEPEG